MASKKGDPSGPRYPDPATMTYEQAVKALESIIDRIEQGQIGLEDSIGAYKHGMALIRRCRAILEKAEQEIEMLDSADEGGGDSPK